MIDIDLISNIVIGGIDQEDFPDFCDSYIESGTYKSRDLTDIELDEINEDSAFVYEKTIESMY